MTTNIGFNDGQGRVNYEIVAEALRRGNEVVLFAERVDAKVLLQDGVVAELMPSPGWLPTRLLKDQVFAWRSWRRISVASRHGRERDPVQCDALLTNGFATWAAADVNAVHFVHDAWRRSAHHPWRKKQTVVSLYQVVYNLLNAMLERRAFHRSSAIVAVSDIVRQELIDMGVAETAIATIISGVDSDEFHPGPAERHAFSLPLGPVIALFVGDLSDSRKNLETVLRALVDVPALHLAVAGRHEGTPWPRLASTLGVAERVHFLGFQRNMPGLMRSVNLFVFPSRYEPFGLVFLEAFASGLPVISARSAGGASLVTSDVGVVTEDSEDVAALSQALLWLTSSDARRETMGLAARSLALQYTWPEMAARYVDLLELAAVNATMGTVVAPKAPIAARNLRDSESPVST